MLWDTLLPNISDIAIENIEFSDSSVEIKLHTKSSTSHCPDCKMVSSKVHSRYVRTISDLPWANSSVVIRLKVRRFFCTNTECLRKFFTERIDGLSCYSRRTRRMTSSLLSLGMKLGGRSGSEIASKFKMRVSPSTILRLIKGVPEKIFETPKVLGVDDWAIRKGRTYGTILVDLEKKKPIELLPDRESETLEEWLKGHPGVEIISRDRSGSYALGAKNGAPTAHPVADRWHLLKNLTMALKKMMEKYHSENRLVAIKIAEDQYLKLIEALPDKDKSEPPKTMKKGKLPSKYELQFKEVKKLQKQNLSQREISRRTGISRETISKYFKWEYYPEKVKVIGRKSIVHPYSAYLKKRFEEGEKDYKALFEEIQNKSFTGSITALRNFLRNNNMLIPKKTPGTRKPQPIIYSSRKLGYILGKKEEDLLEKEREYLNHLYQLCPLTKDASELALEFKTFLKNRAYNSLDDWIEKAKNSGPNALQNFAKGLINDYEAVKNAFKMEWSNGQVEGQVNRLKMIKRQMYGRAGFILLRKRVLYSSA